METRRNYLKHSPDEVGDDEELYDTVDDANGPALHYHRLGGFVGEKVCYTRPHLCSLAPVTTKKSPPLYALPLGLTGSCTRVSHRRARGQSSHMLFITWACQVQRFQTAPALDGGVDRRTRPAPQMVLSSRNLCELPSIPSCLSFSCTQRISDTP